MLLVVSCLDYHADSHFNGSCYFSVTFLMLHLILTGNRSSDSKSTGPVGMPKKTALLQRIKMLNKDEGRKILSSITREVISLLQK
jgi:hypothetical protein